jgi:hypothetical protein
VCQLAERFFCKVGARYILRSKDLAVLYAFVYESFSFICALAQNRCPTVCQYVLPV